MKIAPARLLLVLAPCYQRLTTKFTANNLCGDNILWQVTRHFLSKFTSQTKRVVNGVDLYSAFDSQLQKLLANLIARINPVFGQLPHGELGLTDQLKCILSFLYLKCHINKFTFIWVG